MSATPSDVREFLEILKGAGELVVIDREVDWDLELGAISFDAVKMILLARLEHRPARLDMSLYPYLPRANVGVTDTRAYLGLIPDAHRVTMKGASA